MFFLKGATGKPHTEDDLITTVNAIKSYKKYCDALGIDFLVVPMPDKESVYYDLVPLPTQPDYLLRFDSMVKSAGINSINTLQVYNDYLQKNSVLLYHLDDAHWNPNATEVVADEIVKKLKSNNHFSAVLNSSISQLKQ